MMVDVTSVPLLQQLVWVCPAIFLLGLVSRGSSTFSHSSQPSYNIAFFKNIGLDFCVVLKNSVELRHGYNLKWFYFGFVDFTKTHFCIFNLVPQCKSACLKI